MGGWRFLLRKSLTTSEDLSFEFGLPQDVTQRIIRIFPARINPYFKKLIKNPDDPIGRQVVPSPRELEDSGSTLDPLEERAYNPVAGLLHRYPDRVVVLVTTQCAVYCRFCNRKRMVGRRGRLGPSQLTHAIGYIRVHREVRDVLLSGGDPLLLEDKVVESLLGELRNIAHVEILRIGTRVPCSLPQRVTWRLCGILRKFHPLFISVHFNHPRELTHEALEACRRLVESGIPLGSQTVLLKGVNDDPYVMLELMVGLARARVKPYYLFQLDQVAGASHFKTPIRTGMEISRFLMERLPLQWVPQFVVDLPGGGGKVPLAPTAVGCSWV